MPNGYTSGPYWSNPPFLISDIRALWRSVLSARAPECQKIKNGGLDQYGDERFGRLIFATVRKNVGMKELTAFLIHKLLRVISSHLWSTLYIQWHYEQLQATSSESVRVSLQRSGQGELYWDFF